MTSDDIHSAYDMLHGPRVPRITTRNSYALDDGKPLRAGITYRLYPRSYFEDFIPGSPEIIIVIHGLRNDSRGALEKVIVARNMLARLDTCRIISPVVGFSYDSNTLGAHIRRHQIRALEAGRRIARENGRHLAKFVVNFKSDDANMRTRIHLIGHSLGSEVAFHALMYLAYGMTGGLSAKGSAAVSAAPPPPPARTGLRLQPATRGIIEGVHLFGSSLPCDIQEATSVRHAIDHIINGKIVNCYAPTDNVLLEAHSEGVFEKDVGPLGLHGACVAGPRRGKFTTASKYVQRLVSPADHRFASYADALDSFP